MNSTSAVEVSIHAVSPELIFDESTENGALGAAGADAAASAAAGAAGAADACATGTEAAAGAEASCANAQPSPPASNEPAINNVINSLRIFLSSYPSVFL
ncbi:hypothetical protein HDG37_008011 [Paraburkholderia sp. MM5384-R2]|nr:hypothetical protein [Paraburkholderia sp. MM5384-R2]